MMNVDRTSIRSHDNEKAQEVGAQTVKYRGLGTRQSTRNNLVKCFSEVSMSSETRVTRVVIMRSLYSLRTSDIMLVGIAISVIPYHMMHDNKTSRMRWDESSISHAKL